MIQDTRCKIHDTGYMMHEKGQLLIEAAIAISILTIGIFGMINLLNRSLGLNVVVTSQYIGSNLAMEGVEVVKNLIDSNVLQGKWNNGLNLDKDGYYEIQYDTPSLSSKICNLSNSIASCLLSARLLNKTNGIYSYIGDGNTPFKRIVRIENIIRDGKPAEIQVNSIVSWKIKGGNHEINVEDHFFNWRQ